MKATVQVHPTHLMMWIRLQKKKYQKVKGGSKKLGGSSILGTFRRFSESKAVNCIKCSEEIMKVGLKHVPWLGQGADHQCPDHVWFAEALGKNP